MNKFEMPKIELLMFDEEEVLLDGSGTGTETFSIGNEYAKAGEVSFDQVMVKTTGQ